VRGLLALIAMMLGAAPPPAVAQDAVNSSAPDAIAVTIYRAPNRSADQEIDRDWLQGYALITEQRTIKIPAGRATIRFDGVAAGILPESAIVTGLPQGVREKNLDADLLSPRSLFARSFGRPVTIRREVGKKIVEERAIIRSGVDGAAILQTRDGFEAVNCSPQRDSLVYGEVPAELPARPTLSIETDAPHAAQATITLSYLAWGFDWQANYVATLGPDGRHADLTAWVTMASSDTTSFTNAEAIVVAGKVKREDSAPYRSDRSGDATFEFRCFERPADFLGPQMMMQRAVSVPVSAIAEGAMDIVVTGSRMTRQEDLGDLKLYRVPDRTTVAAMAQKQVAMLERRSVPVDIVYVARVSGDARIGTPMIMLRAVNRKEKGLGLPLPAGAVAVFQPRNGVPLLVGEGSLDDKAIGEDVEITVGEATQVTAEVDNTESPDDREDYVLTVRNANPFPIRFEADFSIDTPQRMSAWAKLTRKNGHNSWAIEVPANGTREFRYSVKDED
jgi:hypothetical protein